MKKYIFLFMVPVLAVLFLINGCQQNIAETGSVPEVDISNVEKLTVGQEAVAGDIIWVINETTDLGTLLIDDGSDAFLETEYGKFIGITFTVENTGQEPRVLYDLTAIDDKGNSYSICLPAFAFFSPEQACTLQEIIPGTEHTYSATFDVDTDVKELVLVLTDLNIPPQNIVYIDLDL